MIYPRLREALDLRNRIFHYEPIYHWTLPSKAMSLKERHQRLCEVISWICPVQSVFLKGLDRFREVHDEGKERYFEKVQLAFWEDEEQAKEE